MSLSPSSQKLPIPTSSFITTLPSPQEKYLAAHLAHLRGKMDHLIALDVNINTCTDTNTNKSIQSQMQKLAKEYNALKAFIWKLEGMRKEGGKRSKGLKLSEILRGEVLNPEFREIEIQGSEYKASDEGGKLIDEENKVIQVPEKVREDIDILTKELEKWTLSPKVELRDKDDFGCVMKNNEAFRISQRLRDEFEGEYCGWRGWI